MTDYYINTHYSQYAQGNLPIVRQQGCTPTTGCNGIDASTGGHTVITPNQMWELIPVKDQENPATPGWSLNDLDHACAKLGIPFTNRSGLPWSKVIEYHNEGYYIALQGDCDQLGGCSGFLGDHCLGMHPLGTSKLSRCDEPTRLTASTFTLDQLHNYAVKFSGSEQHIRFGTFDNKVPIMGLTVAMQRPFKGQIVMTDPNGGYILTSDATWHTGGTVKPGWVKDAYYVATLTQPFKAGATTFPAGTEVIGIGTNEAVVIRSQVFECEKT